jgi:hypothetical protein
MRVVACVVPVSSVPASVQVAWAIWQCCIRVNEWVEEVQIDEETGEKKTTLLILVLVSYG